MNLVTFGYHHRYHNNVSRYPKFMDVYVTPAGDFDDALFALRLHGIFMILAWWFLLPMAIISVRYFKLELSNKLFSNMIWFQAHRLWALSGVACTIIGLLFVLIHRNWTWVSRDNRQECAHGALGILAVVGIIIQPIIGFTRCRVGHPQRKIFNWVHRIFGLTVWLFAQGTILLATWFPSGGLMPSQSLGEFPRGVVCVYWFVATFLVIALELCQISQKVAEALSADEENIHYALYTEDQISYISKRAKIMMFKGVVWTLITICSTLLSGIMIFYITVASVS